MDVKNMNDKAKTETMSKSEMDKMMKSMNCTGCNMKNDKKSGK